MNRTAVTVDVARLTPVLAKCYGEGSAVAFFSISWGEHRTIACSRGVQQGHPVGSAMFCLSLSPGLKYFRAAREEAGVEAFAYMDDITLHLMG